MSETTIQPKVRTRFAPSPTGFMHIGNFRSALYNYLFAKRSGGEFLLRIEDTDRNRFVEGAAESLIRMLETMGVFYSEGVFLKNTNGVKKDEILRFAQDDTVSSSNYPNLIEAGEFGPYIQSERLELYKQYAEELVAKKKAYHCFCDAERLEQVRTEQQANKQMPKYDRHCLHLDAETIHNNISAGKPHVIRLLIPEDETISFPDAVRGEVKFHTSTIDDQVLLKSDGYATYHLANVVDDHLMHITHVIRGEEWLSSTPKHILLYRAFGWEDTMPTFAHLPLLLNPDRSKLSKRQGDVAVEDYLAKGYLPEALINFVALLGWNPGEGSTQEIFSLEALVEHFDLGHVHKGGAVFDIKKLDWLNAQYIKAMDIETLLEQSKPFFATKEFFRSAGESQQSDEYLRRVLVIEQERLNRLDEVGEHNPFFFTTPKLDIILVFSKGNNSAVSFDALQRAEKLLESLTDDEWTREIIAEKLLIEAGDKRGDFFWPLRVALTSAKFSPPPGDVAWVLGKAESLKRVHEAALTAQQFATEH
jgi:glutamyl-tRNA synthetase